MEYLILEDYFYNTVYFKGEKRDYPTENDVKELKRRVAEREGIDPSMIICKVGR